MAAGQHGDHHEFNVNGSGQKRRRLSGKQAADCKPGELPSGIASAAAVQDNGVLSVSSEKKRKFSPIIWDLNDDKRCGYIGSKSKNEPLEPVALPPPPPLPHGSVPIRIVRQSTEFASSLDLRWGDDQEAGQLEEEEVEKDYDHARNISNSRWADGNNALEDDEVNADTDKIMLKKRRSKNMPNPADRRTHSKAPSPEICEVLREGSKSSCSEGDHRRLQEAKGDRNKYMDVEVDGEEPIGVASDHLSDTNSEDSSVRVGSPESTYTPQRNIDMFQGCKRVDEFERLNRIDEGTYGVVYRARDKKRGEIVALKKVKMEKEREGFPLTSLREINILLSFHHPSIVDVKEVVVGSSLDSIFMVMEYMEHDLKGLMEMMKQPFSQSEVKCLMLQLLGGVNYLHDNWVLHRDLKTSNILLNNRGELKICDFGLSRQYGFPLKPYTHLVVTLWYRAPELLLGQKEYSTAIDMWSLGCIMAELLAKEPLFCGKTEFDQLDKIFRTLGTPNEKIWPGFSKLPCVKANFVKQPFNKLREKFPPTSFSGLPTLSEAGIDLLNKLLTYDPEKRITADAALQHDWFREVPLPKSKDFMPTFPAQHNQDRRVRRIMKSPDPLEVQRKKELQQRELGTGSLFG